jgi:hypothetical protein
MKSLWDFYLEQVFDLDPVLHQMGRVNGVNVSVERQNALREKIQVEVAELIEEAQKAVPEELRPTKIWKKQPQDRLTQQIWVPGMVKVCSKCYETVTSKVAHQKGRQNPCKGANIEKVPGQTAAFLEVLPFNPLSGPQMVAYCKHYKHPLAKHMKTGQDTLDKKHLKKLVGKYGETHAIYRIAARIRVVNKVLSTFVDGFKPDSKGKIYGTYTHAPATFRLSQKSCNFMQVSHREDAVYAEEIRSTIVPSPGHVFVEADSSAIEAVMTGYFAGDPAYIELAKKSVHAYLCCLDLGWEFNEENIRKVKKEQKGLYARMKQTVHGSSYGMGPGMLLANNPTVFKTKTEAAAAQKKFFDACPTIPKWWAQIKMFAYRNGFLENPWGLRNYFGQPLRRDSQDDTRIVDGEDSDKAVAFLPQSSAACFMRENLKLLAKDWLPYMPANGVCHDSYLLDVPAHLEEQAIEALIKVLTRPIPQMQNLTVGCEVGVGKESWFGVSTVRVVRV